MTRPPSYYIVLTLYHEAGHEEVRGQAAVAHVVYNRTLLRDKTVKQVIYEPKQFSCFNEDKNPAMPSTRIVTVAEKIVKRVQRDRLKGYTFYGADHYHATYMDPYPSWSRDMVVVAQIGLHIFYRSY